MIRFANILITLALCQCILQAQEEPEFPGPGPGKGPLKERMIERMESMRVAFLTNRLDLTTDESIKFWPVYNEFAKKRMDLRKDMFLDRKDAKAKNLSEKESQQIVEDQIAIEEKELSLKKNYYEKFKAILPSQKLAKLEPAEMEFRREVLRKLKERREGRMGQRRRE